MVYLLALVFLGAIFGAFVNPGGGAPSKVKLYGLLGVGVASGVLMFFMRNGVLVLAIVTMAVSFVGMLYCARKQKVYSNAQNAAVVLLGVILVCMIVILTMTMGDWETERLIENELKYAKSAAIVMGKTLGERFPNKNALVIVSKNWEKNQRIQEMIDGLKEGIDSKLVIKAIDFPVVPPPKVEEGTDTSMMTEDFYMMEEMLRAEHYDKLIKKYPDCNLVISLIGLPHDVGDMELWEMPESTRPKVSLLFADVHNLRNAIKADFLMALTYRPGVKFTEDAAPSDPQEAFEQRYMIVSKDNVEEVAEKYPNFFMNYN